MTNERSPRADRHVAMSAVAAGKARRLRRIVQSDGHAFIVALDHAAVMGGGPGRASALAVASGRPDAMLATWHLARSCSEELAECGLVLRVDGGISELGASS